MNGVSHCLVRVPDIAPVTLATFLLEHAVTDAIGRDLALALLSQGTSVACDLRDGRSVLLERRGLFVVGELLPACDSLREACLDAIGHRMVDRTIPGGTVDVWLAPVSTGALVSLMAEPCRRWPEILFAVVGAARGAGPDPVQDLYTADRTGVAQSFYAEATLMAWATCVRAGEYLAAGYPALAQDGLRAFTRLLSELPPTVGERFAPRLDALWAQAEALQARLSANEVA